jgi:hypothetical protein
LLLALLEGWRDRPHAEQGYGPGNVVNLLRLLRGDLSGLDLGRLALRQAYLAGVEAQNTSLASGRSPVRRGAGRGLQFAHVRGAEQRRHVPGSRDGRRGGLAVADCGPRAAAGPTGAHQPGLWRGASADGRLLASGGLDGIVQLWEAPSGRQLASASEDGTVRLWEAPTGRLLAMVQGHTTGVWGVALSADARLLASGGLDGTVRLWEAPTGRLLAMVQGHTTGVWGVALSADARLLASRRLDGTIRLRDGTSGANLRTLRSDRRYERLDITGLTGVTAAQHAAL